MSNEQPPKLTGSHDPVAKKEKQKVHTKSMTLVILSCFTKRKTSFSDRLISARRVHIYMYFYSKFVTYTPGTAITYKSVNVQLLAQLIMDMQLLPGVNMSSLPWVEVKYLACVYVCAGQCTRVCARQPSYSSTCKAAHLCM